LSFQFRSYIEPAAVMVTIPLAMIGIVWGHVLMGIEVSMPSIMGAASLASTVLVLLVVPAIFCVFNDFGWVSVEKGQD